MHDLTGTGAGELPLWRSSGSPLREAAAVSRRALRGDLPARYAEEWRAPFDARVAARLRPGMHVLDVGSGWKPSVPVSIRPADCRYVGLDVSLSELERAPAGSYDDVVIADARHRVAALEGRFDLVLSCQVLEHVRPLDEVVANLRSYLRPGGRLIAFFSGTFSVFALANRVLPRRVGVWTMERLLSRPSDTMFRAYYDRCWASAVERVFADWSEVEVVPRWHGAGYFAFSSALTALYVGYEEWARRSGFLNLAPYYLVDAVR